jgi:acyl dehydratase
MTMTLTVGQTVIRTRTLTQDDFNRFAALSGDDNPIHVDPDFSARTKFGKTVCHGMLLYTLICGALEQYFPGARQIEQDLMFPTPTFVGEQVTVRLQVADVQPTQHMARLETLITRPNGEVACQGQTTIRWDQV